MDDLQIDNLITNAMLDISATYLRYKKHKKVGFELGFRYDNFLPNQSQTNNTNNKNKITQ